MNWKEKCFFTLAEENMFENSWHKTRFKELLDCYKDSPFLSKGLCKCMYLSAWDEEHFRVMLEILTMMSLGKETDTTEMRINGDALAKEQTDDEYYIYQLSNAFLDGIPFQPGETANISPEFVYIIQRALKVSEIIDNLT
ncbi:MAG: hypothetical protein Q4C52_07165 [Eubacteriales bacterium]|nr:hypothetical protein [Eubacteriales bacterium]